MNLIKKYKIHIIGIVFGMIAGFFYYDQIGCITGTCAITSSPGTSTLYGGLLGYLVASVFADRRKPVFKDKP